MFERHWLQNDLSAVCIENLITITRLARTFQSTRTRRCREQYMPLVTFCLRHFLADSIICMYVFNFRQAQPRLSCKIQYLAGSNHSDQSTTSEYFTDDDICSH